MKVFIILIVVAVVLGNVAASELKKTDICHIRNTVEIYNAGNGTNY